MSNEFLLNVRDGVANDPRVNLVADLGDRLLIKIKVADVERHEKIQKVRAVDPADIGLLAKTVRRDKEPIYPICLYVEADEEGTLHYFLADGHQRHRALVEAGTTETHAQVVLRWKSAQDAMADGVTLNTARYQMTDNDIMEVCATGLMNSHQIAEVTGKSVQTVERYVLVANHDYLRRAVVSRFIGYVSAHKLLQATGNEPTKLIALKNSFLKVYQDAERRANKLAHTIKINMGKKKYDNATRTKAKVEFYGRGMDWSVWTSVIEDSDPIQVNGQPFLDLDGAKGANKLAVVIGDKKEWEEKVALHNFGDRKWGDIADDDLETIQENWNWMGDQIRKKLNERRLVLASASPQVEEIALPKLDEQYPDMEPAEDEASEQTFLPEDTDEDA